MPKIKKESRTFIQMNEEHLINEVQQRRILYDKALKGYRKPAIRETAWSEVATAMCSSGKHGGFPPLHSNFGRTHIKRQTSIYARIFQRIALHVP